MAAGDLIYVVLKWQGIAYRHYGIDMGDGTAIHLASPPDGVADGAADGAVELASPTLNRGPQWCQMEVRQDPLEVFAARTNRPLEVDSIGKPLPIEKTLELAKRSLGQKGYHLSEHNCEHFARFCKTGQGVSWQVEHSKNGAACGVRWGLKLAAKSPRVAKALQCAVPTAFQSWKMTPLLLASDVVEWGATTFAGRYASSPKQAKKIGRSAGIATAAVVGGCVGGPVGATAMVGLHLASTHLADQLTQRLLRSLPNSAST